MGDDDASASADAVAHPSRSSAPLPSASRAPAVSSAAEQGNPWADDLGLVSSSSPLVPLPPTYPSQVVKDGSGGVGVMGIVFLLCFGATGAALFRSARAHPLGLRGVASDMQSLLDRVTSPQGPAAQYAVVPGSAEDTPGEGGDEESQLLPRGGGRGGAVSRSGGGMQLGSAALPVLNAQDAAGWDWEEDSEEAPFPAATVPYTGAAPVTVHGGGSGGGLPSALPSPAAVVENVDAWGGGDLELGLEDVDAWGGGDLELGLEAAPQASGAAEAADDGDGWDDW